MRLQGKVAVVTGASMGIGEAIARLFAEEGASVVFSSRDLGRAEAARSRNGHAERTMAVACDMRTREDIDRLLSLTLHNFGRLDIWVNNAGHGLLGSVAGMDMNHCRSLFETNLFGAVYGMQVAIPVMRSQGSGTVINISSVAGHIPLLHSAAYSASKSALNSMGKAARVELHGSGVNVLTVCPGFVSTDFSSNAIKGADRKRIGVARNPGITAERVARATLDGYLKGKREVVVPWWYHILIKMYQLFPTVMEYGMRRTLSPADEVIAAAQAARKRA